MHVERTIWVNLILEREGAEVVYESKLGFAGKLVKASAHIGEPGTFSVPVEGYRAALDAIAVRIEIVGEPIVFEGPLALLPCAHPYGGETTSFGRSVACTADRLLRFSAWLGRFPKGKACALPLLLTVYLTFIEEEKED